MSRVEAIARINLGNLYSYRKEHDKAAAEYKTANERATASKDFVLASQACMNLARNAVAAGDYASAETWTDRVVKNATKLPDSHDKAFQLLRRRSDL